MALFASVRPPGRRDAGPSSLHSLGFQEEPDAGLRGASLRSRYVRRCRVSCPRAAPRRARGACSALRVEGARRTRQGRAEAGAFGAAARRRDSRRRDARRTRAERRAGGGKPSPTPARRSRPWETRRRERGCAGARRACGGRAALRAGVAAGGNTALRRPRAALRGAEPGRGRGRVRARFKRGRRAARGGRRSHGSGRSQRCAAAPFGARGAPPSLARASSPPSARLAARRPRPGSPARGRSSLFRFSPPAAASPGTTPAPPAAPPRSRWPRPAPRAPATAAPAA